MLQFFHKICHILGSFADMLDCYMFIAIASTVIFGIMLLVLPHLDFEVEDAGDIGGDGSFTFLSIQSILAFLMGLGWTGTLCTVEWPHLPGVVAFLISLAAGGVFLFLSTWIMAQVRKLDHQPKFDLALALGSVGTAYIRFTPNGKGKVRLKLNGKMSIFSAINSTDRAIDSFDLVRVVDVKGGTFYVEKLDKGG
jgi:membrane protein implicated in regulation of membrane protease activity